MANTTSSLKEIGTELAPAPPGQEHGTLTAWIQDLIFTVDHKKLGLMYIGMAWLFFIPAGILQSGNHDARHRHDLFLRHADGVRISQLHRSVADRRQRHGVPAPECIF